MLRSVCARVEPVAAFGLTRIATGTLCFAPLRRRSRFGPLRPPRAGGGTFSAISARLSPWPCCAAAHGRVPCRAAATQPMPSAPARFAAADRRLCPSNLTFTALTSTPQRAALARLDPARPIGIVFARPMKRPVLAPALLRRPTWPLVFVSPSCSARRASSPPSLPVCFQAVAGRNSVDQVACPSPCKPRRLRLSRWHGAISRRATDLAPRGVPSPPAAPPPRATSTPCRRRVSGLLRCRRPPARIVPTTSSCSFLSASLTTSCLSVTRECSNGGPPGLPGGR